MKSNHCYIHSREKLGTKGQADDWTNRWSAFHRTSIGGSKKWHTKNPKLLRLSVNNKNILNDTLIYYIRGWSRTLIWASVEPCQVEGQPEVPPWLAVRDKILKIWTLRYSKNTFAESLVLLTVLNQLWKCVVFVMSHSSLPKFCNNIYKIM